MPFVSAEYIIANMHSQHTQKLSLREFDQFISLGATMPPTGGRPVRAVKSESRADASSVADAAWLQVRVATRTRGNRESVMMENTWP